MKILIVEDDDKIVQSISYAFKVAWPTTEILPAEWGQEGIDLVASKSPNIIILDLNLPDMNGLNVIKQIRTFSQVPILVLTVDSSETMVVQALELGANDYITKPFRQMELIARVKSLLRVHNGIENGNNFMWGSLFYDYNRREIVYNNKNISLTSIENEIFRALIDNSPNIVSYETIADIVWGDSYNGVADSLKVHINHLRQKLEINSKKPSIVLSKTGVGYYAIRPKS
jgi:two-component system KDP operon response regulator KdpE